MTSFSEKLQPGEEIVATAKRHIGAVAVPVIIALAGAAWLFLDLGDALERLKAASFLLLAPGIWYSLRALAARFTTQFVLTDERLLGESGVLRRKTLELGLSKIDRVEVKRSLLGRALGYGTVLISGGSQVRLEYPQIGDPEGFASQVRAEMASPRKAAVAG